MTKWSGSDIATVYEHMKKSIGITPVIIIMAGLLAGCGERVEENREEEIAKQIEIYVNEREEYLWQMYMKAL